MGRGLPPGAGGADIADVQGEQIGDKGQAFDTLTSPKVARAFDHRAEPQKVRDASQSGEVYVFFKHEDEGKGPAFAKRFLATLR